jgi:hypothetical protein
MGEKSKVSQILRGILPIDSSLQPISDPFFPGNFLFSHCNLAENGVL